MKTLQPIFTIVFFGLFLHVTAQPNITSVTPSTGPVGTTVTIGGTNFSATPANNTVYFGATKANITAASTNSLTVTVPVGATYHLITVQTSGLIAYSDQPFLTTYVCGDPLNVSSFANDGYLTAGTNPRSVPLGDVDGDGKPDIVSANYLANSISVFLNTSISGNISFAPKVDYSSAGDPSDTWIGDLDGDGKPEVVAVNNSTQNASVFRNTCTVGNVSFAAPQNFGIGNYGYRVSACDLDGDGKSDIVALNANSNTFSILRNTSTVGSLSFAAKVDYSASTYPSGLEIIDLDGDGKPEITVALRNSNLVTIYRNTCTSGNISFAAGVDLTPGTAPFDVASGDFDGDGKPDLAAVNRTSNTVSLFRNTCTIGTISFATKVDFVTDVNPHHVLIGDMDGDGQPDIVTANHTPNTLSILLNASSVGSFLFAPKVDYATGGSNAIDASIGDLDGDNKPDLTVTNEVSAQIAVLRNQLVCLAGVDENDPIHSMTLYPNPFNSQTKIFFEYELKDATLKIVNVLGKEVETIVFTGDQITIEREGLNAGTYFIHVFSENKRIGTQKVIIQ